jgi:hypothetical protein
MKDLVQVSYHRVTNYKRHKKTSNFRLNCFQKHELQDVIIDENICKGTIKCYSET